MSYLCYFPSYYNDKHITLCVYQLILEHEAKPRQPAWYHQIQQLKDLDYNYHLPWIA